MQKQIKASSEDFALCEALHRRYGTTYYFATRRLPPDQRRRVHALYGFVRVADEWVDNPGAMTLEETQTRLQNFRHELLEGLAGNTPDEAVLRAFCASAIEIGLPPEEPLVFLDAMEQDLTVDRYETWDDLCGYMRGSAAAVGVMMCYVLGAPRDEQTVASAKALGCAMQLTNFIRDVAEDFERGRIYLPLEDLRRFGVSESDVAEGRVSNGFRELMQFEIQRARDLYAEADPGIDRIPRESQLGVRLARVLYSRILDRVEQQDCDVFRSRARTSALEKVTTALALAVKN